MTVTNLGGYTIGEAVPSAAAAAASVSASANVSIGNLQGQIDGLTLAAQASLPNITQTLQIAQDMVAAIGAAIAVGGASASFQASAITDQLAALSAQLAELNAQVAFAAALSQNLSQPGLYLYSYEGQAGQLGTEFQAELSGGFPGGTAGDQTFALLFATTSPITWAAMQAIFKTLA